MFRRQQHEKYLHSELICPYYTTFCVNTGLSLSVSIFSPKIFAPEKSFEHGHFPHSGNLLNYLFFFLNNLANKFDKNSVGLYRGDGLALFKSINGHCVDKIRKEFPQLFGEEDNTKRIIYRN